MDKLDEIMAWKRTEIESRIRPVRASELENLARISRQGPSFRDALARPDRLSVIAEIKRRSPSAGDIAAAIDAAEQARIYYNAGADAISVLTDRKFFGGALRDLWDVNDLLQARDDAPPTLRKDFMIHPVQVVEAAEAGARAILIIVRALNDERIQELFQTATAAGLDTLFEIHTEPELERAVNAGARIIGVNNRDLTRFETDLAVSESLIPNIPKGIITISESGIFDLEDAERARGAGADAVLIGQALMEAEDPDAFIDALHTL